MATEDERLQTEAERLRRLKVLGRSDAVNRLFDYLVERSRVEGSPKEFEIAQAVFGRGADFDISQDSSVRVYMHRLRGKLDSYYAGPGRNDPVRLTIPKGEYRLIAAERGGEAEEAVSARRGTSPPWLAIAFALLLALNLVFGGIWVWQSGQDGFGFARKSSAWAGLARDERPITLVVGDYYIFGEADEHRDVTRLVREYYINSPQDLSGFLMENPDLASRYVNLDLFYLPVSVATALKNITPILASNARDRDRVRVVSASAMTPDMLKRSNIVYVGYLSGLRLLQQPLFAGSRFQVGETFDELIDERTGQTYVSQEGGPEIPQEARTDYGYFATLKGPEGATIVVVAGTRDVAVMQTAEAVSTREGLAELAARAGGAEEFEALYEVTGVNRVNMRGKLLLVSPIRSSRIWTGALDSER